MIEKLLKIATYKALFESTRLIQLLPAFAVCLFLSLLSFVADLVGIDRGDMYLGLCIIVFAFHNDLKDAFTKTR